MKREIKDPELQEWSHRLRTGIALINTYKSKLQSKGVSVSLFENLDNTPNHLEPIKFIQGDLDAIIERTVIETN